MNTVATAFILIMIWGGDSHHSGFGVIDREFSSLETCEAARKVLEAAHRTGADGMKLRAQGCFKK